MKIWYWTREFAEHESFPETHIFTTEDEARRTMVAEAVELQKLIGPHAWITESLDCEPITFIIRDPGCMLAQTVTTLNVQRESGAVDMFQLQSQNVDHTATDEEKPYVDAARAIHEREGTLEIDDCANASARGKTPAPMWQHGSGSMTGICTHEQRNPSFTLPFGFNVRDAWKRIYEHHRQFGLKSIIYTRAERLEINAEFLPLVKHGRPWGNEPFIVVVGGGQKMTPWKFSERLELELKALSIADFSNGMTYADSLIG